MKGMALDPFYDVCVGELANTHQFGFRLLTMFS